jgi:hypothetical protein
MTNFYIKLTKSEINVNSLKESGKNENSFTKWFFETLGRGKLYKAIYYFTLVVKECSGIYSTDYKASLIVLLSF